MGTLAPAQSQTKKYLVERKMNEKKNDPKMTLASTHFERTPRPQYRPRAHQFKIIDLHKTSLLLAMLELVVVPSKTVLVGT
jgi:hypothetical protein